MALNSNSSRVAGTISFAVNGTTIPAKGSFSIGFGADKNTAVIGTDAIHGFKSELQVPFIEGTITVRANLDTKALMRIEDATITVQLKGAKTYVLRGAWFAGDGVFNVDEGEMPVRFEGLLLEEV